MGLKTNKQFILEVIEKFENNITVVDSYIDSETKINFKCNNCGHVFLSKPKNLLYNKNILGCPMCIKETYLKNRKDSTLSIGVINDKLKNTDFLVKEYNGATKKSVFVCKFCGKEYNTSLYCILPSRKCDCNKELSEYVTILKRKKLDTIIKDVSIRYRNKFDFSEVSLDSYKDVKTKVNVYCKDCGNYFKVTLNALSNKKTKEFCPVCKKRKIKIKYFLKLKFKYKNNFKIDFMDKNFKSTSKINLVCRSCGLSNVHPLQYFLNYDFKCDCKKFITITKNNKEYFIFSKFRELYKEEIEKYWRILGHKENKIFVKCKKCGIEKSFSMKNFVYSEEYKTCNSCYWINKREENKIDFIKKAVNIHKDKYDYSYVNYINAKSKVKILCKKCNSIFEQEPYVHLICRGCSCYYGSSGELRIREFFINKDISYEEQKTFNGCVNLKKLRFDFYLPLQNTCIEFQGCQHYKPVGFFGGMEAFEESQKRDQIKRDFCNSNNIKLIEIPYWCIDKIDFILNKELNNI